MTTSNIVNIKSCNTSINPDMFIIVQVSREAYETITDTEVIDAAKTHKKFASANYVLKQMYKATYFHKRITL